MIFRKKKIWSLLVWAHMRSCGSWLPVGSFSNACFGLHCSVYAMLDWPTSKFLFQNCCKQQFFGVLCSFVYVSFWRFVSLFAFNKESRSSVTRCYGGCFYLSQWLGFGHLHSLCYCCVHRWFWEGCHFISSVHVTMIMNKRVVSTTTVSLADWMTAVDGWMTAVNLSLAMVLRNSKKCFTTPMKR